MADLRELRVLDVRVPMRDGVELATDVTVMGDGEPRPALLVRTPYSRAGVRGVHDPIGNARAGWAVVLQDVRGRGESGGAFSPFIQEVDDGFDTVEWCARQPWCDGRVAMTGLSYNGAVQWLAALDRPPALKAIAPSVIPADLAGDFAFNGGAFCQGFLSTWALALAASGCEPERAASAFELFAQWPQLLREESGRAALAEILPDYARWVPRQEEYWAPVDVGARLGELDLPAWRLAGWYDLFCEGTIDGYVKMVDHARSPQRLIVGPWSHLTMGAATSGELDFGLAATGVHLSTEVEPFLRAAIDDSMATAGVTVFVMGENTWRDLDSWPPPATSTALHLTTDGVLTASAPEHAQLSWRHDPTDPVPTRGGRILQSGIPLAGPVDQRPIEVRPDVFVWTSDELEGDLTVIGPVTAQLDIRSSAPTYDLTVKVCDVHPDGRSMNVVDAVQRTTAPAGGRRTVEVHVGSTAMQFQRGHRIRVLVASSDFPQYDLLPESQQTLFVGSSRVLLPVIDPGARDDA